MKVYGIKLGMGVLTKQDIQDIREIIREEISGLKTDMSELKTDVSTLKTDVRQNRVMLEQATDDRQKMLEMLTTLTQQADESSNTNSQVESHEQKIHVNKTAIKCHISDKTVHLDS